MADVTGGSDPVFNKKREKDEEGNIILYGRSPGEKSGSSSGPGCVYLAAIGLGIFYTLMSSFGEKREKEKIKTDFFRSKLETFVDTNKDGLSFEENHEIRKLMNLQDSAATYFPKLQDWERGYENMLNIQSNVEKKLSQ